jgi:hypothetical protein
MATFMPHLFRLLFVSTRNAPENSSQFFVASVIK